MAKGMHWCPNECGRSAYYCIWKLKEEKKHKPYYCSGCGERFSIEEMSELNPRLKKHSRSKEYQNI